MHPRRCAWVRMAANVGASPREHPHHHRWHLSATHAKRSSTDRLTCSVYSSHSIEASLGSESIFLQEQGRATAVAGWQAGVDRVEVSEHVVDRRIAFLCLSSTVAVKGGRPRRMKRKAGKGRKGGGGGSEGDEGSAIARLAKRPYCTEHLPPCVADSESTCSSQELASTPW